jgi:hypothetical protein
MRGRELFFMLACIGACWGCGGGGAGSPGAAGSTGTGVGGGTGAAGTSGGGGSGVVMMGTGRYLPMKVNTTWTYKITDTATQTVTSRVHNVEAFELVGGMKPTTMAFRIKEITAGGGSQVSWQEDTTTSIIRHREETFDPTGLMKQDEWYAPSRLRVDESPAHLVKAAQWTDNYSQTTTPTGMPAVVSARIDNWVVEAVDEVVTVPAGSFSCLRVHRVGQMTTTGIVDKTYWFSRGVGKIKEFSGAGTEELSAYSIP